MHRGFELGDPLLPLKGRDIKNCEEIESTAGQGAKSLATEQGTDERKPGGFPLAVLAVAAILLNLYAGGCVIHELGPIAAASALVATPSFTFDFLLAGLGFYLFAIGLVGLVALPLRLITKQRFSGVAFLMWTTAVNFFLVAIVGIGIGSG